MKTPLTLAALLQLCLLTMLPAQENVGWKRFLFQENANYHAVCAEVERYFDTQKRQPAPDNEAEFNWEDEGSEYNQFMRWRWFWSSRINADGSFPDIRDMAAPRQGARSQKQATDRGGSGASCGWQLISQNTCTGGYNGMGRTTAIAFHPADPKTFYVGSPNGGVWKTTDGGDNYAPISEGLPYNGASSLMVDYNDPNVIYASNGDHSGWWTYSTGIWKSVDAGATWLPTGLNWSLAQNVAVLGAAMHPQNPAILLVAASNGLWRTEDGGANWAKVRDGFHSDVEFRPGDGSVAYAALHDYWGVSQIYKSENSGEDWSQISDFSFPRNWIRLTVSPANPDLLAAVCIYDGKREFYFSNANGAGLTYRSDCPESDILMFSPLNPNVIYCGAVNAYRSNDQGNSWIKISHWHGGQPEPEIHADQRNVSFQPGTNRIFFCNDGGIYAYDEPTENWQERSNGLIITQFYRIAVSQTNETFMIGGTQDNGGRKRVGVGEWESTNGGDAMEVAIDYTNPDILYTTYINGQLYRSMDGWVNDVYNRISNNLPGQTPEHDLSGAWVAPYQIDPLNPAVLVLGYADVYRTANRGATWTKISNNLTGSANAKLEALRIAPSNSNIIYAALGNKLYRTTNLGDNWTTRTAPGDAPITSITVHPQNPDVVYITRGSYNAGQKVYRSDNGGANWTNITGSLPNVPTNCVYLDVAADGSFLLFAGNDLGVWFRGSKMSDWRGFNQDLPVTIVSDLELQQSSRKLRAGTYGRGIWEYDLNHLPAASFAICTGESRAKICLPQTFSTTIDANAFEDLGGFINLSVGGLPNGAQATLSASELTPGSSAAITLNLPAGIAEGEYPVTIYGVAGGDTAVAYIRLTLVSNDFSALALTAPGNGQSGVSRFPMLYWNGVPDADYYDLHLATSPVFDSASIVRSYTNLQKDSLQWNVSLEEGRVYYWRVKPANECVAGSWTEPFVFVTASKTCLPAVASDLPKNISANGTPTVESTINVNQNGPISELKVSNLEGNHQFFRDLEVSLLSPAGTEVSLFKNKCASYSGGFKLGFDDVAPQAFGCPPPQNGNYYRPEGQLGTFAGQNAAGAWTLRVKDTQVSSGGQLKGFALEFCSTVALNPPLIVKNQLLQIAPGNNAAVGADLLKTEDANTPAAQLIYTLVTAPKFGQLQRNWAGEMLVGDQFSQADLDNGAIRYFDYGIPNAGDNFRFSVTDGEGGLAADVFHIRQFPSGTDEPGNALSFMLAPNPAAETARLTLSEGLNSEAQVMLFNLAGQLMQSQTLPAGATDLRIGMEDLPEGVYMVLLRGEHAMGLRKIVKGGK